MQHRRPTWVVQKFFHTAPKTAAYYEQDDANHGFKPLGMHSLALRKGGGWHTGCCIGGFEIMQHRRRAWGVQKFFWFEESRRQLMFSTALMLLDKYKAVVKLKDMLHKKGWRASKLLGG